MSDIDWSDLTSKVSNHFTVKELTWLPSWNTFHIPSEEDKQNLIKLANAMDQVRDFLGLAISVHVCIRPILDNPNSSHNGHDYNALIGGAPNSAHKIGLAMDFDCGESCDNTRSKLEDKLEDFGMRMEKTPGSNWVHLDLMPVLPGHNRYFIP